jgi:hypothetical protein
MISVKTLGLDATSMVTALGAVMFDPSGETDAHLEKQNQFYTTVSNFDSTVNGFKVDPVTITWLKSHGGLTPISPDLMNANTSVTTALLSLIAFIEKNQPAKYWANSPRFHFTYIEGVCKKLSIPMKFNHQQEADYRTIMDIKYPNREDRPAHDINVAGYPQQHALGDAIMQAANLVEVLRDPVFAPLKGLFMGKQAQEKYAN